jgi:hypothetical protein
MLMGSPVGGPFHFWIAYVLLVANGTSLRWQHCNILAAIGGKADIGRLLLIDIDQ